MEEPKVVEIVELYLNKLKNIIRTIKEQYILRGSVVTDIFAENDEGHVLFIVEAKGLNSARSEFSGDEAKIEAENCKAKYSLEYLQKFMKGAKLCEKSILQFANDHPLKAKFKTEHMELSFILAPRVETED